MNITAIVLAASAFAAVGASANAADMSDMDYLRAARCHALASTDLVDVDTAAIDKMLRDERYGRSSYVLERANSERSRAGRQARSAEGDERTRLLAEVNGPCQAWLGGAASVTTAKAGGPAAD